MPHIKLEQIQTHKWLLYLDNKVKGRVLQLPDNSFYVIMELGVYTVYRDVEDFNNVIPVCLRIYESHTEVDSFRQDLESLLEAAIKQAQYDSADSVTMLLQQQVDMLKSIYIDKLDSFKNKYYI